MSMKYSVRTLPTADADMDALEQYIVEQCAAPLTAARQFQILYKLFDWLEEFAGLPAVHVPLLAKRWRLSMKSKMISCIYIVSCRRV